MTTILHEFSEIFGKEIVKHLIPKICEYLASRGILVEANELFDLSSISLCSLTGKCNKARVPGHFFCARCMRKKTFITHAQRYADENDITLENVIGRERYEDYLEESDIYTDTPSFITSRKPKEKIEELSDNFKSSNTISIEGLPGFYTNKELNFIFDEKGSVVGQWNEDYKITPLTPSSIYTARILDIRIGPYEKYNFGKYEIY